MSLAHLITQDQQPTPVKQTAQQIDAALLKLQATASAAVRALDDRRLYHDEADLRAAIWPGVSQAEADAYIALEPLLRQWAEPVLAADDAEALSAAASKVAGKPDA